MKSFLLVSLLTIGALVASQLHAEDAGDPVVSAIVKQVAGNERLSLQMAPIKTRRALSLYIQSMPKEISAFSGISPNLRDEFVNSLKFNERGLTEFDPSPLRRLSPTQVYSIWLYLG
ncbi:hypothetical protein [Xanthomonas fragariae]|uniref:hypothetical protein n=1 Tax=Xanthomonas fragariae TaxID=48664 RepID=UPI0022AA4052|nr:hypothetical protein [Xanthomonas fragariae]WAT16442.1 hypothetical protein OZ429_09460 [Xanthomonas fragariae]